MNEVAARFEGFEDYGRDGRGLWRAYRRRARAAAGLDAGIERPVDVSAEAAPGGWLPVLAERHNHPLF